MSPETKKFLLYKITSKKLWALISVWVLALMVLLGAPEAFQNQVLALIGATASVVIYIWGETTVDVARIQAEALKASVKTEEE